MPLQCPRCAAPYRTGMLFCQYCGSSLLSTSATPMIPTGGVAPQQGAVQSPDLQGAIAAQPASPTAAQPDPSAQLPGHVPPGYGPSRAAYGYGAVPRYRLSQSTILGLVIAALGFVAAIGILTSHHGGGSQAAGVAVATAAATSRTPLPTSPALAPTSVATNPALAPTTLPGQPTAAAPSTPLVQPTAAQAQPTAPGTGRTVSTGTFSVQVPAGWQVANQSRTELLLQNPSTAPNQLDIGAGQVNSPTSAQAVLQGILATLQQNYPDAKQCGTPAAGTLSGVSGTQTDYCFTFTPQGGAAFAADEHVWAGTSPNGTFEYLVAGMAAASNQAFFASADPVVGSIQWGAGSQ